MKLYGKNPVLERIKADSGSIKKLYLKQKTDLSEIVKEAKKQTLDFISVSQREFSGLTGEINSQGVLAEVKDYRYADFSRIIEDAKRRSTVPVFIDGVTDPQNFGSIIRTLACLGGFSIVIPLHSSVEVTETVLRVASGGENYIRIARIVNTAKGVLEAKEQQITVIGAEAGEEENIMKKQLDLPLAVVIGSEGKGIRPGIEKHLDMKLTLPMRGASLSFNVATATALFCYEITRKRFLA